MTVDNSTPRHIVVVGGGIIGASTAFYLTRHATLPPGSGITILETSKFIAPGASGKSGGFLALDWQGTATSSLAKLSYRLHREMADEFDGKEKWGYREVETAQVNVDTSKTRNKSLPGADWLDSKVITSTSNIGGGGTTAQVTPRLLTEHLVREAEKSGAHIRLGTRATGVGKDENGALKAVKIQDADGESTIEATDIVLAAGPWTGTLVSKLFGKDLSRGLKNAASIDGSRAHSVIFQSAQPLSAHCLFTDMHYGQGGRKAGAPEVYCRPDGTAYVCGGSDDVPLPDTADEVGYDPKKTAELREQSAVLAPVALGERAKVQVEQACYLPISGRTGNPLIGPAAPGVWLAAGHTCWGITNSLGTGKVLAELILDGKASSADVGSLMP